MESPRVFRLTRTSLHQLADLSKYAGTQLYAPAMRPNCDRDSTVDSLERSSVFSRSSRPLAKFNPTVRSRDADSRSEHRSLVSMRAFYAFGARSASVSSNVPYRSRSSLSHGDFDISASYARPQLSEANASLARSSTSASVYEPRRPPSTKLTQPPSSSLAYRAAIPKYSAVRTHISATYRPQTTYDAAGLSRKFSATTLPLRYTTKVEKMEFLNIRPSSPTKVRPLKITLTSDISSLDAHSAFHSPPYANSTSSKTKEAPRSEAIKPSERKRVPAVDETTSIKQEAIAKDIAELNSLRKRNEALEAEVQRLQSLLREKERSEHELKRRLIESEAETKVWKTKCEMQPTIIEIREPACDGADISADLINELDSAAEKLVRLNAVKDLKMLQGEMETALKEIQER